MSSESDKGRRDGGVRNVKALFEGRTTGGADSEGQEGSGRGEVEGGIPVRRYWGEGAQAWGPAELQSHRVEEGTVGWLEESLQCRLKWRDTTQPRAGTLMTSKLRGTRSQQALGCRDRVEVSTRGGGRTSRGMSADVSSSVQRG